MRRAALIALLALAASACTIDVDVGISLDRNGSGSLTVDIVTDQEFEQLHRITGRDFEDLVATRGSEVGLAFTVTPGTENRYSAVVNGLPAPTLTGILEGLAPGIGEVAVTSEPTSLEFDASLNPLTSIADVAPYFDDSDPAQFEPDVDVTVTVTMEGAIDTSTATRQDDDRLIWMVPFSDSSTRLVARSMFEGDERRVPWTLLIGGATLLLAIGFLVSIRSTLEESQASSPSVPPPHTPAELPEDQAPDSYAPEDQPISVDATPPEDQPVAPPADTD